MFLGRTPDGKAWERVQTFLKNNSNSFLGRPMPDLAPGAAMEDSIHRPRFSSRSTVRRTASRPMLQSFSASEASITLRARHPLNRDLGSSGAESARLLERRIELKPGETRSVHFLDGYSPQGFGLDALIAKYQAEVGLLWPRSSSHWKTDGVRFRVPSGPWVEGGTSWHNYYFRSNRTYDSFSCLTEFIFRRHTKHSEQRIVKSWRLRSRI